MSGDILAVAYQTQKVGQQKAGLELFDCSVPEKPRSISFFDCSGATSRGVHQLWFCDGEYVHMASGAPDFQPSHPLDDQFYRCIDVRNPSKPVEVGRWWMPGTMKGDSAAPPPRHALDKGYRAHNTNVYKQRPDRMYLCYIDGGMFVMDIADKSKPKAISHWTNSPPYTGFMHTALPLFDRGLLIVTDESTRTAPRTGPSWCGYSTCATRRTRYRSPPARCRRSMPTRTAAAASARIICMRTRRCRPPGSRTDPARYLLQRRPARLRHFQRLSAEGNRSLRAAAPKGSPAGAIQLNDVFVDERGIVYTMDRFSGGLYTLEMDF